MKCLLSGSACEKLENESAMEWDVGCQNPDVVLGTEKMEAVEEMPTNYASSAGLAPVDAAAVLLSGSWSVLIVCACMPSQHGQLMQRSCTAILLPYIAECQHPQWHPPV